MNIGIIGAGVTGIGAAWRLARQGHSVTLYEKEGGIGGLARAMVLNERHVERYYHFIMTADTYLLEMIRDMGVEDRLNWVETATRFFANGKMYNFTTPLDLLRFGAIGLVDRLRFMATMGYLTKCAGDWKKMEDRLACEFLPRWAGQATWDVIFRPMFDMKFGELTPRMSMAWMWARSRMIQQYREKGVGGERRAWMGGSMKTFLDACEAWFAQNGVTVLCHQPATAILTENGRAVGVRDDEGEERRFDRILFCAPSGALTDMLPGGAQGPWFDLIRSQRYYGVTCVVMALDRPLSDCFWTYVSDPRVPFVGVIDYASFTCCDGDVGQNVIYIPCYSLTDSAPYTTDDETLVDQYVAGLKVVFPDFDRSRIRDLRVMRNPTAAIVCDGRYSERIPAMKTPLENLYFANLSQIYPQDRGVSVGLKLAEYAAQAVEENRDVAMDFVPY